MLDMRLEELEPKWWAEEGRQGQGFVFRCPHCLKVWICVALANPLDGGAPWTLSPSPRSMWEVIYPTVLPKGEVLVPPGILWERAGQDFAGLSVRPSVDASRSGHWHGFILEGGVFLPHEVHAVRRKDEGPGD